MTTRILALVCALTATACGGADSKPAESPNSAYDPAATVERTSVTGALFTDPATARPNAAGTTTTTDARETGEASATASPRGTNAATPPPPAPSDSAKAPDNTKVNERDRSSAALTPMDQGNSASETKTSAAIRRGIVGDKSLSFMAKNVKIITVGTKVTLRGPVKTEQERAAVELLARQTTGVTDVDNQLEVKN